MEETLIGKYKIVDEIGRGGMGIVYRGEQVSLGRLVAIKTLPLELAHDQEYLDRIENEAQILAQFTHPCIVYIHDRERKDDSVYLIMEYVPGETVAERIRKEGPFELKEAARIVIRVASALDHAHKKGVIHRDIKPSNIMIREDNAVKVTDFGIAKSSEGSDITRVRWTPGTRDYMSPEQSQGYQDIDGRSDIYSLGIVFYLMITGKLPPHPVPDRLPFVPPRYEKIILKCLAEDRAERYGTADELILDLEEAENRHAQHQKKITPERKPMRRFAMFAATLTLLVIAGALIWKFDLIRIDVERSVEKTVVKLPPSDQIEKHEVPAEIPAREEPQPTKKQPATAPAAKQEEADQAETQIAKSEPIVAPMSDEGEAEREESKTLAVSEPVVEREQPPLVPEPVLPALVLRPAVERINEMMSGLRNPHGMGVQGGIRSIFTLKTGVVEDSGDQPEMAYRVKERLGQTGLVRGLDQGGCDLLVGINFTPLEVALTVQSNLHASDIARSHQESFFFTDENQLMSSLEPIIKRYYCFNILNSMDHLDANESGYSTAFSIKGGSSGSFRVGDSIELCVSSGRKAYAILLSVNAEGLYLLFPQTREEHVPLVAGKPFCTPPMEISPPTGTELVAAILFSEKSLLPIDPYLAGDEAVIIEPASWSYDLSAADNAVAYCETLFTSLYNAPPDKYATRSEFIKTVN